MQEHERIHHDITPHHATSNRITNREREPKASMGTRNANLKTNMTVTRHSRANETS